MMQSDNARRYKRSPEIPQTHHWIQSMHKRLKVRQHNVVSDNKSQHAKQARHGDEKRMFPSGTQTPSHVPQCLTEVWAAGARRAPQQDLGPLLSLCVRSGERTVIGQRGCQAAGTCDRERERECWISWHLNSKWFESITLLNHAPWWFTARKVKRYYICDLQMYNLKIIIQLNLFKKEPKQLVNIVFCKGYSNRSEYSFCWGLFSAAD